MTPQDVLNQAAYAIGSSKDVRIAEEVGVSAALVGMWKAGKRRISTEHLIILCRLAGVDILDVKEEKVQPDESQLRLAALEAENRMLREELAEMARVQVTMGQIIRRLEALEVQAKAQECLRRDRAAGGARARPKMNTK